VHAWHLTELLEFNSRDTTSLRCCCCCCTTPRITNHHWCVRQTVRLSVAASTPEASIPRRPIQHSRVVQLNIWNKSVKAVIVALACVYQLKMERLISKITCLCWVDVEFYSFTHSPPLSVPHSSWRRVHASDLSVFTCHAMSVFKLWVESVASEHRRFAKTFRRQTELIRVLGNEEAAVPCEAFSRSETLARAANRARQRQRPADLQSLDFNLDTDFLPCNFFRADVKESERSAPFNIRHRCRFVRAATCEDYFLWKEHLKLLGVPLCSYLVYILL